MNPEQNLAGQILPTVQNLPDIIPQYKTPESEKRDKIPHNKIT